MASRTLDFHGALITEQGLTFAVVAVSADVLRGGQRSVSRERGRYEAVFRGVPIVLASRGSDGRAVYNGRADLVRFLAATGWTRIPWKRYRARKKDRNPFREWA